MLPWQGCHWATLYDATSQSGHHDLDMNVQGLNSARYCMVLDLLWQVRVGCQSNVLVTLLCETDISLASAPFRRIQT
jgi:hypothetical protein